MKHWGRSFFCLFSQFVIFWLSGLSIDVHGLKILLDFFVKIPRGVKAFRKNCRGGGSPYLGFYCIFINKCFEICQRGVLYLPSPLPPTSPPLCASMGWSEVNVLKIVVKQIFEQSFKIFCTKSKKICSWKCAFIYQIFN